MDDTAQRFFAQPTHTYHRRYEALRAVFVEGQSQKEVAERFGYTYGTMRQLVFEFRRVCNDLHRPSDAFFFETTVIAPHPPSPRTTNKSPSRR